MSRRNSGDDSAMAALGCLVIFGLIFYWIWEAFQTPTIEKVRQLNGPVNWGGFIEAFPCQACQTANEPGRDFCFRCGERLVLVDKPKSKNAAGLSDLELFIFILLGVAALVLILIGLGNSF